MFGRRRENQPPRIALSKLSSLIGADVQIHGDVEFTGGLRIDGHVRGNVIGRAADGGSALLVLSRNGAIDGSLVCADAVIDGSVSGDLRVERFVDLQANARVQGTLSYRQLRMEVGAVVAGELRQAGADASAPAGNVVELARDDKLAANERG
jgi:cytoskeletal protein CcmA (bactofilin family)